MLGPARFFDSGGVLTEELSTVMVWKVPQDLSRIARVGVEHPWFRSHGHMLVIAETLAPCQKRTA